jgi:outer membrane lipoprotein-sorting protein
MKPLSSGFLIIHVVGLLLGLSTVSFTAAHAQEAKPDAMEIARERKLRDSGWNATEAELEMVLYNKSGDTTSRSLRIRTLEVRNDGNKSLIIFDTPYDVKGTAVLTYSHISGADDQWIFLPSIKRVKRISSNNKSGAFMGSEFAFEDLSSYEVEKYDYKYLGDEVLEGVPTFKLESYPRYEHSGYSKLITWLDQEHYRVHKIAYYDKKGALLKTQKITDFHQYADKYWRANTLLMENHQTGKSTRLNIKQYQFGVPYTESDFTQSVLTRIR